MINILHEERNCKLAIDLSSEHQLTLCSTKKVAKPYFRDWSNLRFHKGKTFIAPKTLIRAEMALYFPNIRGVTLAEPHDEQDTTTALEGRISIICVFTGTWAQVQTASFTDNNEKLRKILKAGKGLIQRADLNVEDNTMKAGLIRMFMGGIRRKLPENRHGRYFLVRRGFEDDMRKNIGIFNNQVGYVYLVDSECRIRWAGCAEADQEEIESLLRGVKRLVQELKQKRAEETKADEEYGVKLVGDIYDAVTSIVE